MVPFYVLGLTKNESISWFWVLPILVEGEQSLTSNKIRLEATQAKKSPSNILPSESISRKSINAFIFIERCLSAMIKKETRTKQVSWHSWHKRKGLP